MRTVDLSAAQFAGTWDTIPNLPTARLDDLPGRRRRRAFPDFTLTRDNSGLCTVTPHTIHAQHIPLEPWHRASSFEAGSELIRDVLDAAAGSLQQLGVPPVCDVAVFPRFGDTAPTTVAELWCGPVIDAAALDATAAKPLPAGARVRWGELLTSRVTAAPAAAFAAEPMFERTVITRTGDEWVVRAGSRRSTSPTISTRAETLAEILAIAAETAGAPSFVDAAAMYVRHDDRLPEPTVLLW